MVAAGQPRRLGRRAVLTVLRHLSCDECSFRCLAWVPVIDDLTFSLEWPAAGISFAAHTASGVRAAASRAVRLWTTES